MLKLDNGVRRLLAQVFDGILVAQPVRPFDRVVHVPAPIVFAHIAKRCANPALRRDGVAARRKHLGNAGGRQALFDQAERGPEACPSSPHHNDIVVMIDEFVIRTHESPPALMRKMEITPAIASSRWIKKDDQRLPACNLGELT